MKKIIHRICYVLLLAILLGTLSYVLLPVLADRYLLPQVTKKLPFAVKKLRVSTISPWRMQGQILLQGSDGGGMVVPHYAVRYSLTGLLQRRVAEVAIDSATIFLEKVDSTFRIVGMQASEKSGNNKLLPDQIVLPFVADNLVLTNTTIMFSQQGQPSRSMEVEGRLKPSYVAAEGEEKRLVSLEGELRSRGVLEALGKFQVESGEKGYHLVFELEVADIGGVGSFLPAAKSVELRGGLRLTGDLETVGLHGIDKYSATADFTAMRADASNFLLENSGADRPVHIKLEGNGSRLHYELTGLLLRQPEPSLIEASGEYQVSTKSVNGTALLTSRRTETSLKLDYQGKLGQETNITYSLETEPLRLPQKIEVAAITGTGTVVLSDDSVAATLSGKIPSIKDNARHIVLSGISFDLPFHHPALAPGVVVPGNVFIDKVTYKGVESGKLEAAISFAGDTVFFNSEVTSPLAADFRLTCSSEVKLQGDMRSNCLLPKVSIDASTLQQLFPLPEKLNFSAEVAAEASFEVNDGIPSGKATIAYSDGSVTFDTLQLDGISGKFDFPALPNLRSSSRQQLRIDTLSLGKIKMSDARVSLRIDDPQTLFIEKAKLRWCGGRVETGGLEIKKNMEQLETTLYCDRLAYTELLGQLGVGDAQGEGSLNGRLPLSISRNGVEFDDGFLFSTPGKSGIVQFNNTKQIRQGIGAADTSVYIDYSMAALENFSYNWTKLTFNTQGSDLLLSLQLDGQPASPLPYGYESGQIVKSEKGKGIQHPIRLDVNFRLPLHELFRYGKNIQSIMENM